MKDIKFNRNKLELFLAFTAIILFLITIYLGLELFEVFPKELPPSEPFEYPKNN
jgi:hypothetical protein